MEAGKTVEVYFLRHGISTWNRKAGPADIGSVMNQYGIGDNAAAAAGVDAGEWRYAMIRCLNQPGNDLLRDDPNSPPPEHVAPLDKLLTDPPLTLDGKRSLREAMPTNAALLHPKPFEAIIVSPMLRTIQTAAIAARLLPCAAQCKWFLDADAREENHAGWIDTWGTASHAELRTRAMSEISCADSIEENTACVVRIPMQESAVLTSTNKHVIQQAAALSKEAGGLHAFLSDINRPLCATEEDAESAVREAEFWASVETQDLPFTYRPGGSMNEERLETTLLADEQVQWWAVSEEIEDVRQRVLAVLQSDAVRNATGPVLIVTHSMFIKVAIDTLVGESTEWLCTAEHPTKGDPKKLIANGGMFMAVVNLSDCSATEAALTAWR